MFGKIYIFIAVIALLGSEIWDDWVGLLVVFSAQSDHFNIISEFSTFMQLRKKGQEL